MVEILNETVMDDRTPLERLRKAQLWPKAVDMGFAPSVAQSMTKDQLLMLLGVRVHLPSVTRSLPEAHKPMPEQSPMTGEDFPEPVPLEQKPMPELRRLAKQMGFKIQPGTKKAQLLEIMKHGPNADVAERHEPVAKASAGDQSGPDEPDGERPAA